MMRKVFCRRCLSDRGECELSRNAWSCWTRLDPLYTLSIGEAVDGAKSAELRDNASMLVFLFKHRKSKREAKHQHNINNWLGYACAGGGGEGKGPGMVIQQIIFHIFRLSPTIYFVFSVAVCRTSAIYAAKRCYPFCLTCFLPPLDPLLFVLLALLLTLLLLLLPQQKATLQIFLLFKRDFNQSKHIKHDLVFLRAASESFQLDNEWMWGGGRRRVSRRIRCTTLTIYRGAFALWVESGISRRVLAAS